MNDFYPIYLNLQNQPCLVVGGGQIAERKVSSLLKCGANVTLISPKITKQIQRWVEQGKITLFKRKYQKGDVNNYFLVIGATNIEKVNRSIAEDSLSRKMLVNIVDDPQKCNFIIPAVVRQGSLSISISTGGKSPLLAQKIRKKLESEFGPEYGDLVDIMGDLRPIIIHEISNINERKKIFSELVESDLLDLLRQGRKDDIKERVSHVLNRHRS